MLIGLKLHSGAKWATTQRDEKRPQSLHVKVFFKINIKCKELIFECGLL